MPFIKDNGQFRFTPDECLTASQIKSFFSCLTRKRRKQTNNSQNFLNQSVTRNNIQQVNSDESDEEIEEEMKILADKFFVRLIKVREINKTDDLEKLFDN
jgi:hypothetical protein